MKEYTPDKIKNIALAGHGGSGKTSLAEALLFRAKATDRLGKISDGNTVCDFDPEEIKRKISVSTAIAPLEYMNTKINIIDTPGLFDFAGGLYEGIRAADTVVIVVSARSGIHVGTEKAYKAAVENHKSVAFYISKMDTENADFYKVLDQLREKFGAGVCPVVVPHVEDGSVKAYVDVINNKAFAYDKTGNTSTIDMPDMGGQYEEICNAINEAVAETDDALMDKFFSGESFTEDELIHGVHDGVKGGSLYPVFCGSSVNMQGGDLLLYCVAKMFPSAEEMPAEVATDKNGDAIEIPCDAKAPFASYVFKTVADPFVGKMSYFKVVAGKMTADMTPVNVRTEQPERLGKLMIVKGKKQEEVKQISAGDIGVVTKLTGACTGDSYCDPGRLVQFAETNFPKPTLSMAIKPKAKGDEGKIAQGLHRLQEEDPTILFEQNPETHQQILSGLGEQHLDVVTSKLKAKFGVEVQLDEPRIPYRETIRKKVKVEGKHKKQSGGHGQFGHVWIEFEPCDSEDLVFEEKVFGGSVPKGFFPAVEKGLRDSIKKGVLAGYPVVGLKATLVDGSYHPVDSSEMSFKTAASLAYKAGLPQASPVLLEPIGNLKVLASDSYTGDIMGELNKRRGRVLGMNPASEGQTEIEAEVPMGEMHDFTTLLRSMTQGSGSFTFAFTRYEQLPGQLEAEVIEKAKALAAEE
ncbi:elongation factor G [Candidatus Soleaferrea massiliensis]|uniref:elongation factor G n=1 Tax=Candidatus Soleaferrea massiliensis TaxID=1470354 RepID=UPI00058EDA0D|nr:elongation factor G [Candidatus Soleaferrea massiliensis]